MELFSKQLALWSESLRKRSEGGDKELEGIHIEVIAEAERVDEAITEV